MPMFAIVSVRPRGGDPIRIWAPLFLLWIVGTPLLVLFLPFINLTMIAMRADPRALSALLRLAVASRGLVVDIQSPGANVLIRVI